VRPGDFLTAELPAGANGGAGTGDRSIIVVRDDHGDLSAHDNVCIHRGARLLEGCGNTARITCPYHAWSYRLDGGLIGAPYMQGTVQSQRKNHSAGAPAAMA
jgi:phenylpropionate dioxygenase-like ring-hydroxylating dioxygenase large terminal subunit